MDPEERNQYKTNPIKKKERKRQETSRPVELAHPDQSLSSVES